MGSIDMSKRLVQALVRPWNLPSGWVAHPRYGAFRDGAILTALMLHGVAAALILTEPWYAPAPAVKTVLIGQKQVPTDTPRSQELLGAIRHRLAQPVVLRGPDFEHPLSWAELGAEVDLELLQKVLAELATPGSPAARSAQALKKKGIEPSLSLPLRLSEQAAVEAIIALKDSLDKTPESAKFDFVGEHVLPEKAGLQLDAYETLNRLQLALVQGADEVDLPISKIDAETTARELAEIEVQAVVGFYETPYSRQKKDENRTHNVRLGASMLDGHILMPGHIFSFNDAMGDRTQARGFRYAPVIAGGVLQEGQGGGTCQVASTLYAAAFFAGLVVEERRPHSRPSSYIKLGLDATVNYPNLDLKLQNPFDFPVAIHFLAEGGILRAEIRGPHRPFTVTLLRQIVATQPFPTKTIDEPLLPKGTQIVTQRGVEGYTVKRYQIIERDKVGYRFQIMDKYPPTVEIVRRGTAASKTPLPDAPKPDNHNAYRATNHLRMVQGPNDLWYEQNHN
jgi:vancomycin resistance protein YoaR